MKKDISNKLDIYKIKTTEELLKYYQNWTDKNKYNKDMVDWNYTAPQETVSVLSKYALNKNSKIKTMFQNFSIWVAVILLLLALMYFIGII